ncbi:MAG: translation initiation factor IF-6 [Candidatus Hermodarchaeia archaeon]
MSGKIQRFDFNGSSNIGAFCRVTDQWVLHAPSNEPTIQGISKLFEATRISTTIGQSTLAGILTAGNQNGLIVPHIILDEELEALQESLGVPVTSLNSKLTALGNLILTNDHAALVSTAFSKTEITAIRDALGVEVEAKTIAGSDLVGSYCVVTNQGLLAHTDVSEEELEWLASFFSVESDLGTINCGVPYISIGLLVTLKAAAAGFETTGPELMRITEVFF